MKRKSSEPPEPQEGLPNPLAKVSITERAPDPAQIDEWIEDPAHRSKFVRASVKHIERLLTLERAAEKRTAAIAPQNELRKQQAKDQREKIREVARELRRTTRKRLQNELSKRGISVSLKTISRALNPK